MTSALPPLQTYALHAQQENILSLARLLVRCLLVSARACQALPMNLLFYVCRAGKTPSRWQVRQNARIVKPTQTP